MNEIILHIIYDFRLLGKIFLSFPVSIGGKKPIPIMKKPPKPEDLHKIKRLQCGAVPLTNTPKSRLIMDAETI